MSGPNTWFSKIALAHHVVRRMCPEAMGEAARAADRVHAGWPRRPGCGQAHFGRRLIRR
jgi:xylan 1,4-beta-xylosidase